MASKKQKNEPGDYEKWTDENVKARSAFFATLNVDKIANELKELSNPPTRKEPKSLKRKAQAPDSEEPRRSSRLMSKPPVSLNEEDVAAARAFEALSERQRLILEESVEFLSCRRELYSSAEDVEAFKKIIKDLPKNGESKAAENPIASNLAKIQVSKVVVSKVTRERACCLAVHPGESQVIIAAGDLNGGIGLRCESSLIGRCEFETHDKRPVSCLVFDTCHLLSSSYDGTLRSLDLNRVDLKFDLLYTAEDEAGITGFDAPSVDCYTSGDIWVSKTDGTVARIDCRAGAKKIVGNYRVNPRHCRSISTCPAKHLVCTASKDGTVAFWDDRKMPALDSTGKKPLATSIHSNSVSSAYLNPSDPHLALSTSHDNTVRISRFEGNDCKIVTSFSHNNNTGRFLTPFRAIWHPTVPFMFGIGSLQRPRCVQLYSSSAQTFAKFGLSELFHDEIGSVQSLLAFHRTLPLVIGINSSGRVHTVHLK